MLLVRAVVAIPWLLPVTFVSCDLGCCLVKVSSHRVSLVTVTVEVVTLRSMLDSSSTNRLSRSDMMISLTGARSDSREVRLVKRDYSQTQGLLVSSPGPFFWVGFCFLFNVWEEDEVRPLVRASVATSFPPTHHVTSHYVRPVGRSVVLGLTNGWLVPSLGMQHSNWVGS